MQFDLIVIGGGINGAGIARDAALRGLRTCLLEQGDLCSSTTRWSSRLIHGGLRYLEYGELGLVHESLRERENLLRNAPHLVQPLPLLIPVYAEARRGLNIVDFGLYVYDLLSAGRSVPGHRRLGPHEALAAMPGLEAEGLTGAVLYHDAQVPFVERLVVENALGAAAAGARVETYTAVERLLLEGNRITGVAVRSLRTGERSVRNAPAVINAAGPWVDRVLATAGQPLPRFLGPTKGTHIVVPSVPGLGGTAVYAEARSDGRPFFIIPWNGLVLIGTTDTRYDGDPATLRVTGAEVDYLLTETRHLFPAAGPDRDSVLYAYCGLRPLPRQGLRASSAITRRHMLRQHGRLARGLISVIGGKITTYRSLAEEAIDAVTRRSGTGPGPCLTGTTPLPGGQAGRGEVLRELARIPSLPADSHAHLYAVYGSRAPLVGALCRTEPALGVPLVPGSACLGAEVVFAVREEFAVGLGDILLRRCMAGLGPDLGRSAVPAALRVAAEYLDWSPARCRDEETAYRAEIAQFAVPD